MKSCSKKLSPDSLHVGAGLLAKAVYQATSSLTDWASSRAGSLPQILCSTQKDRSFRGRGLAVFRYIVACTEPTAESRHQFRMCTQARGLDLLLDLLLLEQQGLGIEHVEVIGKPALVGDHGDVVGFL